MLLDHGVVADGVELQAGGQRDRPQRAVQRQRHVVAFRHGRDLAGFGDTAGMGRIGLDDVHQPVAEDFLEVPAREQPLAQGDGRGGVIGDLLKRLGMFAQDRLFDEHQAEGIELLGQHLGHGAMHPAMEIHRDAKVRSHRFAQRRNPRDHCVELGVVV